MGPCDDIEVELEDYGDLDVVVDTPDIPMAGTGTGSIVIKNSDNSFSETATVSPYIVEDITFNFIVNGVTTSVTAPALVDHTINITI